jgi:signal transduction histidine kinase/CheY-like chemotaxis protein
VKTIIPFSTLTLGLLFLAGMWAISRRIARRLEHSLESSRQSVALAARVETADAQLEDYRRQLETTHAQRQESLSALAGGVAHDLNNLLSALMGNLDLARLRTPEDAPSAPFHARMEDILQRAARLSGQMLAISGRGRFQVKDLDLNQTLRKYGTGQQDLVLDLAPDLPPVTADPDQVRQVLEALVANAREALAANAREALAPGGGGAVHLSTWVADLQGAEAARSSALLPLQPGPHVVLQVRDEGPGMAPPVLSRIFDPFYSTKENGQGLGLATVLGILRSHGAGIQVESAPGQGARFRLFFPVRGAACGVSPEPLPGEPSAQGGKVLLADDDGALRETIQAMLERLGFQVIAVRDGAEAVECFQDRSGEITLVLLDLSMPRMDGHQAFLAIRSLCPKVPVILSSGYDGREILAPFSGQDAPLFLQKPYPLRGLRQALDQALALGS